MCLDPIPCAFMKAKIAQEIMTPLVHNSKRCCSFLNQTVKADIRRAVWGGMGRIRKVRFFFIYLFLILWLFRPVQNKSWLNAFNSTFHLTSINPLLNYPPQFRQMVFDAQKPASTCLWPSDDITTWGRKTLIFRFNLINLALVKLFPFWKIPIRYLSFHLLSHLNM